ncbi:MAG: tetratricopeptide repeat protein [Croceimicrobium sp.]
MTETLPRSLLVITAFWNKIGLIASLILIGLSLSAQSKIEGERLRLFNEQFFAAENAKNRDELDKALVLFEALHQKDPENALVHYELAQLYAREEDQAKAIYHAERAQDLDPDNSWYFRLLLAVYEQFGLQESLQKSLKAALRKNPENEALHFQLAESYYRSGKSDKALNQLEKLEALIGVQEQISNQKKSIYLEIGDLDGAVLELKKLIQKYPKNLDYRGSLGQVYQANGKVEEAFQVYQEMLLIDSLDPRPHLDLANYYQEKGDLHQSLFHLKQAMGSSQLDMERKIAVLLSLFEVSSKDSLLTAKSFELLDEIVSQEPEDPRIYAMYGDYLSREGRDREAISFYKKALAYGEKFQIWEQILLIEMQNRLFEDLRNDAPEAIESFPNQPLPYLLAGIAHQEGDKLNEALEFLEDGLTYVFNNARLQSEFYLQLAAVYHDLENHRESDNYFDEVLAINPKHAGALNNYAYYLSQRDERLEEALEMSTLANTLSPENPVYLDTKAWILHRLERNEEAKPILERALVLMVADDAELLEHYGDILRALAENDLARIQYEKAQNIQFSEERAKKLNDLP